MTLIKTVVTQQPPYEYTTDQIVNAVEVWLKDAPEVIRRKGVKIFRGANIDKRGSVAPLDFIFSDASFEEKNNWYVKSSIEMGEKVLAKALEESGWKANELDYIITTSCTGFMIPSVDAYLINKFGMKQDIVRLPVTEMGCAAGISGLIYVNNFLKANPGKKAALITIEAPSLTFRREDLSLTNLVSTAIFADGATCTLLEGGDEGSGIRILDTDMYHFNESEYLMGYNLTNTGFQIVLDKDVPDSIKSHFPNILPPFLKKNNLEVEDVENYLFHPGGKKIIHMVEDYICRFDKDISDSIDVLRQHGNMSSSTIIFILERFMKKGIKSGEKGYMLAFGPGFSAQSLLVEWV
ncbi:MAG: type III polyketide synthase [Deltaproteobacteria bacterium]|nr:MAG: type III polyketide synthase [Deltaproteobacteria bacterium]TNF31663.1 MAG: type III polyketide synthase [Deltaproteobacteria bacterium]